MISPKEQKFHDAAENLAGIIKFMGNVKSVKVGKSQGMKEFGFGGLALGSVKKEEALLREIIRFVQVLRKKEGLKINDKITLWLTADEDILNIVREMSKEMAIAVGAEEINLGVMKNKKASKTIEGKIIEVGFKK